MTLRRFLAVVMAVVIAAALAGCSPRGRGGGTDVEGTLEWGGVERTYILHVPDRLADDPALVVMLHGGFGSAAQAQRAYGWDEFADREGFLVVYPEGIGRSWNGGDCCGPAVERGIDDVGFLGALVAAIGQEYGVAAVYGTGMSNGAIMTYRVACETSLYDAIAPVAGTLEVPCSDPAATSVLHIHGLEDRAVPFVGGPGVSRNGVSRVDGPAVPAVIALWREAGECGAATTVDRGDPLVVDERADCAGGVTVELITIADAGHQWPGSAVVREGADPPSDRLDATAVIWEFFRAAA